MARQDLLTRYRGGEHREVWRELRSRRGLLDDDREEALAVARETMRRVACGADQIAERLAKRGWSALSGSLRTAPGPEDTAVMARIVEITKAPLPVSLQAFWEVVGGIDFVWNYKLGDEPDLGVRYAMAEMDPLCVDSPRVLDYLCDEWEEHDQREPAERRRYHLDLAPDRYHKANISGGGPYGIHLPYWGVDPKFLDGDHDLPFVRYLRLCFRGAASPVSSATPSARTSLGSWLR